MADFAPGADTWRNGRLLIKKLYDNDDAAKCRGFAVGILCVIIGVVVVVMDLRASELLAEFFNVDTTRDLEEFVVSK